MDDYDLIFQEDLNREVFVLDEIEVEAGEAPAEEIIKSLSLLGVGQ